jgi:hypothetical protein
VSALTYYHQIKKTGLEMKNIEEKEERQDVTRKLSLNRDIRYKRNNLKQPVG